jgi:peptide/nickel transport system substrate-binding protein
VLETKSGNYNDFILRKDNAQTANPDLALAIKYVQDREGMQRALGGGVVGNDQPFYPSHPYFNASLPQRPYDPEKAKFYLGKSGLGSTALPLYVMANQSMVDQAVVLQQSALAIGMNIDLRRMPGDGYWTNVWFKYPFTGGNINPRPSADSLLTLFFASGAPWNETGWKSDKFDKLLVDARAQTDEAKRKALYGELQTLIADDNSLCIPLFNSFYDSHTAKLKGLSSIPTGGMMGFGFSESVWLEG